MKTAKVIIVLSFISLIFPNLLSAQTEVKGTADILFKLRLTKSINGIKEYQYQDIEGNPYLFEKFQLGTIKLKDGGAYSTLLRFDKYAGEVHFKKDTTIYAIAFPEKIESIKMDKTLFIYSDYKNSDSDAIGKIGAYFIVLVDNHCKLLAHNNIRIQDAVPGNGIILTSPSKFVNRNDTYYIKIGDLPAIEFKNKKDLISIFKNQKNSISQFIEKENISSKKIEDLKKLIYYYNSLIINSSK